MKKLAAIALAFLASCSGGSSPTVHHHRFLYSPHCYNLPQDMQILRDNGHAVNYNTPNHIGYWAIDEQKFYTPTEDSTVKACI